MKKNKYNYFQIAISIGLTILVAMFVLAITGNPNFDFEKGNKVCKELNNTNLPISEYAQLKERGSLVLEDICIYSNGTNEKEANYVSKTYHLLDLNRLGKQVD